MNSELVFPTFGLASLQHNAHLFGKIGSVEVVIFKLNKTNNQTVIMADMFQNVNLQTGGVCGISQ